MFEVVTVDSYLLCCTYGQVQPSRRSLQSTRQLGKVVPRASKMQSRVMKARARAVATSLGTRASGVPAFRTVVPATGAVSSLRRTSARLKLLERRTTARFLHVSPHLPTSAPIRLSASEPKHSRSSTLPSSGLLLGSKEMVHRADRYARPPESVPRFPHSDRRKESYLKYMLRTVSDSSRLRHSARFTNRSSHSDREDLEDVSRTFIRHRQLSQRRSEEEADGGNLMLAAGKSKKVPCWHGAILRRSGGSDGGIGRFVIRKSHLPAPSSAIPKSRHTSRFGESLDIYGPRYSSPLASRSASVPSSAASSDYRLVKREAHGGNSDEHLLYAVLSRSGTVGFH